MKALFIKTSCIAMIIGVLSSCVSVATPDPVRRIASTNLDAVASPNQTEIYITRGDNNKKYNRGFIAVYLNGSMVAEVSRGSVEKYIVQNGFHEISVTYSGSSWDTKPIKFYATGGRLDFRTGIYIYGTFRKRAFMLFTQEGGKKLNYIESAAGQTLRNVPKNSKIAIVYITDERRTSQGNQPQNNVVDNVVSDLEIFCVNAGYIIVDRSQLDRLRQEHNFQMSGEVDDETAVSIGKFAGADIIITGRYAAPYRSQLRLRAINTQTAQVIGAASTDSGE